MCASPFSTLNPNGVSQTSNPNILNMITRRFWSPFLRDSSYSYHFSHEIPGNVPPLRFLRRFFADIDPRLTVTFYRFSLDGERIYKLSGPIETLLFVA